MLKHKSISAICIIFAAIATAIAGCNNGKSPENPFVGYWGKVVSDDSLGGFKYFVRLDFQDTTACDQGFENVLGVLTISEDKPIYKGVTADLITDAVITGPYDADIKYIQQRSGQLWSGKIHMDPATKSIHFQQGEMLEPGPDGDTIPVDLPYPVRPTEIEFEHISDRPNYKEIPSYYMVAEMPDRIYYRYIVADEEVEPPFGDVQLRCYYPATDRDVLITNEVGESPIGTRFNATIVDCWRIPDASGIMLVVWSGTTRNQEISLYRVDEDNTFEEVAYVVGRRPVAEIGEAQPDPSEVAKLYRDGKEVKMYNPQTGERHTFDLSGRCLK